MNQKNCSNCPSLEEFTEADEHRMKSACKKAYEHLSVRDQMRIDLIRDDLERSMRGKHRGGKGMGELSSLELLAKLGLWLKDRGF